MTSITAMTAQIQRFICVHGNAPDSIYVGQNEMEDLKRYANVYPGSIDFKGGKRPEVFGVPVFTVDADDHFGLQAGRID